MVILKQWRDRIDALSLRERAAVFACALAVLWYLWFVLLMVVTGLWYLLEEWGLNAPYARYPESPGAQVEVLGVAPLGDPIMVQLDGCRLSLRKAEAEALTIERQ